MDQREVSVSGTGASPGRAPGLAASLNPLAGLAFLCSVPRVFREPVLFMGLLRRFWGSRYLLLPIALSLGAIAYSVGFGELERLLFTKVLMPRPGAGRLLWAYSLLATPLRIWFVLPVLLGFLLRELLQTPFFRREVAGSRLEPEEILRNLLAILSLSLIAFTLVVMVGHAAWQAALLKGNPREFLYSLFPHSRPAPFGDYSVSVVILLEIRDLFIQFVAILCSGLPLAWVVVAVRRPAMALLAALGLHVALMLATAPLEYLFVTFVPPPSDPGGAGQQAYTALSYLVYYAPRLVLLAVLLQWLRVRLFPRLLSRLSEDG